MRAVLLLNLLFLFSCGAEPEKITVASHKTDSPTPAVTQVSTTTITNENATSSDEAQAEEPPLPPPVKKPSGVYRFVLPYDDGKKILHTIAFYPSSYRLQEEYPGKKDSTVVTEGSWAPSEGFIWLYKGQLVRGRYTWKGDTLQYFSPRLKKSFSMEKLAPVTANEIWQTKQQNGVLLYGVGNEPFWSVEVRKTDSVVVNMPDWNAPLQVKLSEATVTKDSTVYTTENDSLRVTVYPLFCSDGMSDFLYTNRVKLIYRGQTYKGCGETLQQAH